MRTPLGYGAVAILAGGLTAWAFVKARGDDHAAPSRDHRHAETVHGAGPSPDLGIVMAGPAAQKPRIGETIQAFMAADSAGRAVQLGGSENAGELTVLTFWCATCGSCRMIDADFDRRAKEHAEKGVRFLAVDSTHGGTPEPVQAFLERSKLSFPVLVDAKSELALYFGARLTTTTAVIDAQGRLRYYGGYDGAEAALQSLLAGEEVAVTESPGSGCAILLGPASGTDEPAHHAGRHGGGHRGHGGHDAAGGLLEHFRERLHLSETQAEQVAEILASLHARMSELGSHGDFPAIRAAAFEKIRATLDADQRAKFDELAEGSSHGSGHGSH